MVVGGKPETSTSRGITFFSTFAPILVLGIHDNFAANFRGAPEVDEEFACNLLSNYAVAEGELGLHGMEVLAYLAT